MIGQEVAPALTAAPSMTTSRQLAEQVVHGAAGSEVFGDRSHHGRVLLGECGHVEVFQRVRVRAGGLFFEDVADREALDGQDDHAGLSQRDAARHQGTHGQFGDRCHGDGRAGRRR